MGYIMNFLSGILGIYTLLIFIRILLTWFPGADFGKPYILLCSLCDPYLDWFRRFRIGRNSPVDFSPILALGFLSLLRGILSAWGTLGRISIAAVLVLLLNALGSIFSWILGFFIVILLLRLIAYLTNRNIYSPLWRFVDLIAQPVMYRIGRIFFPFRIVNYLFRIIFSILILLVIAFLFRIAVYFGSVFLAALPF